jgi:bifunctional non-homologous end joining protein LigD
VDPKLVGEFEFVEWTKSGQLRAPAFKGLRPDKPPKEVVRELG